MSRLLQRPTWAQVAWICALVCGVTPLWVASSLPLVDLPQHLHLISVLHRLDDPSTLYPEWFERRPVLTPYLGYYYSVSALHWLLPLELANRVFLTAYVAGLPLALAFLLRSVNRPGWPAMLALPFAYGDSLAWGFLNFCAALPLAFLTCGFFIRALEDSVHRRRWAVALGIALVLVLLFHVQVFAWLALALPLLLWSTRASGAGAAARIPALLGLVPGVVLFLLWVGLRVGQPQEIAPGEPWRSWGPVLSEQNLAWKSFEQNRAEFISVLANMLPDGADRLAVKVSLGLALLAAAAWLTARGSRLGRTLAAQGALLMLVYFGPPEWRTATAGGALVASVAWVLFRGRSQERVACGAAVATAVVLELLPPLGAWGPGPAHRALAVHLATMVALWSASRSQAPDERRAVDEVVASWRPVGLAATAALLFFALPFDVRGYMYYLNTRYAHLAAALLVGCIPAVSAHWQRVLIWAGPLVSALLAVPLIGGFQAFDREARAVRTLAVQAGERPRVMGLVYAAGSPTSTHPVFLHASAEIARARGGLTNFSFAVTPHNPLMYKKPPPPTFPSEWRPDQMSWEAHGQHYDHFLVRGAHPAQVFGSRLQTDLYVAAQEGDFFLVRRR